MKACECGCGKEVNPEKRFIHGHHARCQSEETKKKRNEALTGRKFTDEHKRKLSESHIGINKGENHYNYGKKLSVETKKKMSESQSGEKHHMFGKKLSDETRRKMCGVQSGENHHMFGKNISEETRRKMSKAKLGNKCPEETKKKISEAKSGKYTGPDNVNWNGGSSFKPYCHKFNNTLKEKIRIRDNRICQNCGIPENGSKHTVHHIHYDKENCYPDLITLCRPCNSKANSNRDYWEVYYMNKLEERGLLNWK